MINQELEAVIALRAGDIGALETIVRLHQSRAMRIAYGILANRQMAEDVVADAFLTAYERIGQCDARRPFAPWFDRIVVTGAQMALRKISRIMPAGLDTAAAGWADPATGQEENALLTEMRVLLRETVWTLPASQRVVVVLHYYLGLDERTIARTMGCPLGTVKWRLHAARARLRRMLKRADKRGWDYILSGEAT